MDCWGQAQGEAGSRNRENMKTVEKKYEKYIEKQKESETIKLS